MSGECNTQRPISRTSTIRRTESQWSLLYPTGDSATSQQREFAITKQMDRSIHPSLAGRRVTFRSLLVRERGFNKLERAIRRRLGLTDEAGGASPRRHYRRREEGKRAKTTKPSPACVVLLEGGGGRGQGRRRREEGSAFGGAGG